MPLGELTLSQLKAAPLQIIASVDDYEPSIPYKNVKSAKIAAADTVPGVVDKHVDSAADHSLDELLDATPTSALACKIARKMQRNERKDLMASSSSSASPSANERSLLAQSAPWLPPTETDKLTQTTLSCPIRIVRKKREK